MISTRQTAILITILSLGIVGLSSLGIIQYNRIKSLEQRQNDKQKQLTATQEALQQLLPTNLGTTSNTTEQTNQTVQQSTTTPNPILVNEAAQERQLWYTLLGWSSDCESSYKQGYDQPTYSGVTSFQISPKEYMVTVLCARAAYQVQQEAFYINANNPHTFVPLTFTLYSKENGKVQTQQERAPYGLLSVNQESKKIVLYRKAAGHGGCGAEGTYMIVQNKLELQEARYQECTATSTADTDAWEVIYKK